MLQNLLAMSDSHSSLSPQTLFFEEPSIHRDLILFDWLGINQERRLPPNPFFIFFASRGVNSD